MSCVCVVYQMARTVLQAQSAAKQEQQQFDELMSWLDHADEVLKVVDQPVKDRQQEHKVCV